MNSKLEFAVAQLRCENKPVKQIAKHLGVKKDEIEKIIKYWIGVTDPYIDKLIGKRSVSSLPNTKEMISKLMHSSTDEILNSPEILDYIAKKRNDHHDRFMDCIRYKIRIKIDDKKE